VWGQVCERLNVSALVQEGDQPPEQPQVLLGELDEMLAQLNRLIVQINQTNVRTRIDGGETLTEASARRDMLDLRLGVLKQVADTAAQRHRPNRPAAARARHHDPGHELDHGVGRIT